MNEYTASKPINPAAAFALGIFGFFAFAALAFVAYFFFRGGRESEVDKEASAARIAAHEEVVKATNETIKTTKWADEAAGTVNPSIDAYLPIAAEQLLKEKPSAFTPPAQ